MSAIAEKFGNALDNDEFEEAKDTLSRDCIYILGDKTLTGPDVIINSYEQNMIEGRKKLDQLVWGQSKVEAINDTEYYVHFTDYLRHNGVDHTFKCKQKLVIRNGKIIRIEHLEDPIERKKLDEFYRKVGLDK